uniref:Pyruvate kinase n=1 Tax=Ishige okamurae TaxID=233772 RepID=A0A097IU63_9PHAE|nr:pyruvate kinase [Ishige okamurae]
MVPQMVLQGYLPSVVEQTMRLVLSAAMVAVAGAFLGNPGGKNFAYRAVNTPSAVRLSHCHRGVVGEHRLRPLSSTAVVDSHTLDPTLHDPRDGEKEVDYFKDYAYPANKMRWKKNTKQIATLGPASCTKEQIEELFLAGVDVFRLNFSHGAHDEKAKLVLLIREVEAKYKHPICILADLQGPKLRVGTFEKDKVTLVEGQTFRFDMDEELGDAGRVMLPHPEIIYTLSEGDQLLLDDGKLRMTVTGNGEGYVDCRVDVGGKLSNKKGVNTPTVRLPISALTSKDLADLDFALQVPGGVDIVALSFVQKTEDVQELKDIVKGRCRVMAKIEKPQAVEDLEQIVSLCDAIMVARGDLGVEMPPELVPITQKKIIDCCRNKGTPVVVATQMLESMIENPTPTRAEASDVATAIYDGADGIMLSAESAAGRYPKESVEMQQKIITAVEQDPLYRAYMVKLKVPQKTGSATDAITRAAEQVADTLNAKAIVVFTSRGTTVQKAAMLRPGVPVMGVTPNIETARGLALTWGVYPAVIEPESEDVNFRMMLFKCCAVAQAKQIAEKTTDLLVVTAGMPFKVPGIANILRVVPAAGPDIWDPTLTTDAVDGLHTEAYINYDSEN